VSASAKHSKDGIPYHAPTLAAEVREIVKKRAQPELAVQIQKEIQRSKLRPCIFRDAASEPGKKGYDDRRV
jgi:hypothetical protein